MNKVLRHKLYLFVYFLLGDKIILQDGRQREKNLTLIMALGDQIT